MTATAPLEVRTHPIALVPAALVCSAAVLLFGFQLNLAGYAMLVAGLLIAWFIDRSGRTERLTADLALIAIGQAIISTMPLKADISFPAMVRFAVVLGSAVAVPFLISRFLYRERVIRFPWRTGRRWTRTQWLYLVGVTVAGSLILPFYFITSGVYQN